MEILVPDLAGWRRERMLGLPQDHRFEVVPNWICEVLSPGTMKKDRMLKMKVYARNGVAHLWLVQSPGDLGEEPKVGAAVQAADGVSPRS